MVITVQCPSCITSFPVDTNKVPVGGVNARCSSCGQIFRVERPEDSLPPPPAAEVIPPAAVEGPVVDDFATFEVAQEFEGGGVAGGEDEGGFSVGTEAPAAGSESDWVLEREEAIDAGSLTIEPMRTVESTVDEARTEGSFFGTRPRAGAAPALPEPEAAAERTPGAREPAQAVGSFTLGKRDPRDKARRLARVLVSDMIMYNPERHERALANGTLKQDFEDEIAKSWKEYVDQVGEEMATQNPFWTDALNDVLAKGEQVF